MVGEQIIFSLIVMVVVLVLDVLEDLRDPKRGNFSITDELNSREYPPLDFGLFFEG